MSLFRATVRRENIVRNIRKRLALTPLFLGALVRPPLVFGLDSGKTLRQYASQEWREELPNSSVSAILQTRDGYLWIGTQDGLARFDGVRFTIIDDETIVRLDRIEKLVETRDNSLWATGRGGLARIRKTKASIVWESDPYDPDTQIRALHETPDGRLWAALADGLALWEESRFRIDPKQAAMTGGAHAFWTDRDARLHVAADNGAFLLDGDSLVSEPHIALPTQTSIFDVQERADGALWIATLAGLYECRQACRRFTSADGLCANRVQQLVQDRNGTLWAATTGGLSRLRPGSERSFECFGEADGLADVRVMSLREDREGSLWIGMDAGGLLRLSDGACMTYTKQEGLCDDAALCVFEDRRGVLWIGTEHGVSAFHAGAFRAMTKRDGLPDDNIRSLNEDRDGSLWIGTQNGLARLRPTGSIEVFGTSQGLSSASMRAVLVTRDGSLWIGTENQGLDRLKNGRFTRLTIRDGLSSDLMGFLFEDRSGRLWAGTAESGLNRIENDTITTITAADGLANNRPRCMYEDRDGGLWIGTYGGGVSRLRAGRFTNYSTAQGLPDNVIYQILEDDAGHLWMSSNRGIIRVARRDFDDLDGGRIRRLASRVFDTADGMKSRECKGRFQPSGIRARDGRLWFATRKGVVRIDPTRLPFNALPPPVVLEGVVADDRDYAPGSEARFRPGTRELLFDYTALSFVAAHRVRFKYRLDGYDRDWRHAGEERAARYQNLGPGDYEFHVTACNNDGVWNEKGATFRFQLAPHFHQTPWFFLLVAFGAAAGAGSLYAVRHRLTRRRYAAILAERTRIARELHDTLMQDFLSITWQLQALAESLAQGTESVKQQLAQIIQRAQAYLAETRLSVMELRGQKLERRDLRGALEGLALRLTEGTALEVDVRTVASGMPLSTETENQLLRIAQEAVLNVVKHAHARRIDIELEQAPRRVTVRVKDDGCGFETEALRQVGRFGLLGMRERAEQIGGKLHVDSIPGEGTEIRVAVPLRG
jgi:ligand-binding sensor domain-containing protein/signal transduction histidine kinase